uniref:Uncharacterized protein n=1 Tax=Rhodnius prolixus TaxID=13249 RepID=T1I6Z4_RHOPR
MASSEINVLNINDNNNVPEWKKNLMVDFKTYARTITSANGSIKLTVTCPKAMRQKLREQISSPKEKSKPNVNNELGKFEQKIDVTKLKENSKLSEESVNHKKETIIDEVQNCLTCEKKVIKPGLVQSLKTKYLSMVKEENVTRRRPTSCECILEKKSFNQDSSRRQIIFADKNLFLKKDELPTPRTVKKTKEKFEPIVNPVTENLVDLSPIIRPNKPPLNAKPNIIPKRSKKPNLTLDNLHLSPQRSFKNAKSLSNGVGEAIFPIKSV